MRNLKFISSLVLVCCFCATLLGQEKKKNGGIESWDKNKDGLLQEDEIPVKVRPAIKKWAAGLELNPEKPLPIKKLMAAKGGKNKGDSMQKKAAKEEAKNSKDRSKKKQDEEVAKPRERKVAGFGKTSTKSAAPVVKGAEKGSEDKKTKEEKRAERTYKTLARSLLYQNDENKNGKLEKNEWARLKGNPARADANKDGVLTTDELAKHLRGYGSRERDVTRRTTFSRSSRSKKNKNGKSYRFLSPHERLPEGLPDWFIEQDENLDGQISLVEYVPEISLARLKKFEQFDVNGDGFIEAKEYLKSTK